MYTAFVYRRDEQIKTTIMDAIENRWVFIHTDSMGFAYLCDQTKDPAGFVHDDLMVTIKQLKTIAMKHGYSQAEVDAMGTEIAKFINFRYGWTPELRQEHYSLPPYEW